TVRGNSPRAHRPESSELCCGSTAGGGVVAGTQGGIHLRRNAFRSGTMSGLSGCGTALVTPFTATGAVDEPALRALVEWQIESGIDFLVPCGSTGEAQTLSAEERERVVSVVVETAKGRVHVMAGASHNDTRQAVEDARRMSSLGVQWLLVATPYYNKPTPDGLYRHFVAVADASAVPICLQRPGPDGGESQTGNHSAAGPARERGGDQGIEWGPGSGPAHSGRTSGRFRGP